MSARLAQPRLETHVRLGSRRCQPVPTLRVCLYQRSPPRCCTPSCEPAINDTWSSRRCNGDGQSAAIRETATTFGVPDPCLKGVRSLSLELPIIPRLLALKRDTLWTCQVRPSVLHDCIVGCSRRHAAHQNLPACTAQMLTGVLLLQVRFATAWW